MDRKVTKYEKRSTSVASTSLSLEQFPSDRSSRPKVVLAYSGGLDTSIILHWLKDGKGM